MSEVRLLPLPLSALPQAKTLLKAACAYDQAHIVAEEKLFAAGNTQGPPTAFGAFLKDDLVGLASVSASWIRVLAVHPKYRARGIGSALLQACVDRIALAQSEARIMDEPGNYLSPGIDKRNHQTIAWLEKRSFAIVGSACNLRIALQDNERVTTQRAAERKEKAKALGYQITRIEPAQLSSTCSMIEANFSKGWAMEVKRAASYQPAGVFLALHNESREVVAFAAHDGNNQGLGCFGPAGTLDEHREKGLGAALLLPCLLDIRDAGHSHAEVAWIGPRDFYDKIAGIESERSFARMSRLLQPKDDHD